MVLDIDPHDLEAQMRIADVASTLRRRSDEIGDILDNTNRTKLKQIILDSAKVTGNLLTDGQVENAINVYLSDVYSFKEPATGWTRTLLEAWVDRAYHFKTKVVLPTIAVGILSAIGLTGHGIRQASRHSQESEIETQVESAFMLQQRLSSRIQSYQGQPIAEPSWEAERDQHLSEALSHLTSTANFFNTFCSEGTAADDVDLSNYLSTKEQLPPIHATLKQASGSIDKAALIVQSYGQSHKVKESLDTLIAGIRDSKAPAILETQAEAAYKTGIAALTARNVEEAEAQQRALVGLTASIQDFLVLPQQMEQAYLGINAVAKEKQARVKADAMYTNGKQAIETADIPVLKNIVSELKLMQQQLELEYELVIVTRTGERTAVWRRDNSTGKVSGHYAIVEPIHKGNRLTLPIWNHEENRMINASIWGEWIPESVYDAMGRDKQDDGHMDTNGGIFALKQRGYLNETITYPGVGDNDNRQITQW